MSGYSKFLPRVLSACVGVFEALGSLKHVYAEIREADKCNYAGNIPCPKCGSPNTFNGAATRRLSEDTTMYSLWICNDCDSCVESTERREPDEPCGVCKYCVQQKSV